LAKDVGSKATARQEGGLTEQRNQLTTRIRVWEQLLPIYMPGQLQYKADLQASNGGLPHVPEHPEEVELWLPSQIPQAARHRVCVEKLPSIEDKLRTAQCYDSLDSLRHILKIKSRLIQFKNKNLRGQREGNRSRDVIDRIHGRARVAAEKYRAARASKILLSGPGDWETELKPLADGDIRGYQDAKRLRICVGRRGIWEDDQVEVEGSIAVDGPAAETDSFTLYDEERTRRDGTGETRRTLSWIWTSGTFTDDPENANDEILRAEWSKSRARAARAREEVLLLREEMRRVLEFLGWKARWWLYFAD
jgi:hypothetical protein